MRPPHAAWPSQGGGGLTASSCTAIALCTAMAIGPLLQVVLCAAGQWVNLDQAGSTAKSCSLGLPSLTVLTVALQAAMSASSCRSAAPCQQHVTAACVLLRVFFSAALPALEVDCQTVSDMAYLGSTTSPHLHCWQQQGLDLQAMLYISQLVSSRSVAKRRA